VIDFSAKQVAYEVVRMIECRAPEPDIAARCADLARRLGGNADLSQMKPGGAALYLLALIVAHPGT
jgi:hypothetical protein